MVSRVGVAPASFPSRLHWVICVSGCCPRLQKDFISMQRVRPGQELCDKCLIPSGRARLVSLTAGDGQSTDGRISTIRAVSFDRSVPCP